MAGVNVDAAEEVLAAFAFGAAAGVLALAAEVDEARVALVVEEIAVICAIVFRIDAKAFGENVK